MKCTDLCPTSRLCARCAGEQRWRLVVLDARKVFRQIISQSKAIKDYSSIYTQQKMANRMSFLEWLEQPRQIVLTCLFFVFLCWLITKFSRRRRKQGIRVRDPKKGHAWQHSDFLVKPTYCSICETSCVRGCYCETCWICVHDECEVTANEKVACKATSSPRGKLMYHHWVRGNLPLCSKCDICKEPCGMEPRLSDYQCMWCHRTVHEKFCYCRQEHECDFGKMRELVIPPYSITLKTVGWRGQRKVVVKDVVKPTFDKWEPLLVFSNPKSGGNEGTNLLKAFRGLLNPAQVIDLSEISPEVALEFCNLLPDVQFRILICGGDGTIGWVLNAIESLHLSKPPYTAILPLGTGNDLARVLHWGKKYLGDVHEIEDVLCDIEEAELIHLDRWKVNIETEGLFHVKSSPKEFKMSSYLSVGCDAQVVLNFHKHREKQPSLFTSRIINKLMYFIYGSKDVLEQECRNLHERIELELDGKKINLPTLEGILVLNIGSWCGGCEIWDCFPESTAPKVSFSDGLLEVVGLYSSLHIARVRVNLAEPVMLGQARSVKIKVKGTKQARNIPMQIDGEPWEQKPCTINISYHNKVLMLQRKENPDG